MTRCDLLSLSSHFCFCQSPHDHRPLPAPTALSFTQTAARIFLPASPVSSLDDGWWPSGAAYGF